MIKNIRHVGIVSSNLDKAISLYRDTLGLKIVKQEELEGKYIKHLLLIDKLIYVKLSTPNKQLLELYYFPNIIDRMTNIPLEGYNHIAFTVKDIKETYKKLLKTDCEYITKPILDPIKKHKVMFYRDFDSNLLELVEEL